MAKYCSACAFGVPKGNLLERGQKQSIYTYKIGAKTYKFALLDPGPDAQYFRVEEAATTMAAAVSTGNVM